MSGSTPSEPSMSSALLEPTMQLNAPPNTERTQASNTTPKPPSNLDVALQAFIGKFIPSNNAKASVDQIIRGTSHNAESLCTPLTTQPRMTSQSLHHPTQHAMTVVHKLEDFTEKMVRENMELNEENELLKAQIAALRAKQPVVYFMLWTHTPFTFYFLFCVFICDLI